MSEHRAAITPEIENAYQNWAAAVLDLQFTITLPDRIGTWRQPLPRVRGQVVTRVTVSRGDQTIDIPFTFNGQTVNIVDPVFANDVVTFHWSEIS